MVEKTLLQVLNASVESRTSFQVEYRLTLPKGETYWISNLLQPFRDDDGRPTRIVGSLQNVSERKCAELESQASKRIFQAVIENNIDAIMLLDREGMIKYISPSAEFMLGYPPDAFAGASPFDIVHHEDQLKLRMALDPILHEPLAVTRTEYRARHKQGHWVWIEAVAKNFLAVTRYPSHCSQLSRHLRTEAGRTDGGSD